MLRYGFHPNSGTDSSTNVRITAAPNLLKMAWIVGRRNEATAGKLYHQLSQLKECIFDTNGWKGYRQVWPTERQVRGKKHTICLEPKSSNTRHYLGRMSGRSKIVNRSEEMISLSMARWQAQTQAEIFPDYQTKFIYKWTLSKDFVKTLTFDNGKNLLHRRKSVRN